MHVPLVFESNACFHTFISPEVPATFAAVALSLVLPILPGRCRIEQRKWFPETQCERVKVRGTTEVGVRAEDGTDSGAREEDGLRGIEHLAHNSAQTEAKAACCRKDRTRFEAPLGPHSISNSSIHQNSFQATDENTHTVHLSRFLKKVSLA